MGRGRAKAKQTKVARQLKYGTGGTDLSRLEAELAANRGEAPADLHPAAENEDDELDLDEYEAADFDGEADRATGR
jgi:hypothetical protein